MGNEVLFDGSSRAGTNIGRVNDEYRVTERRAAVRVLAGNHARDAKDLAELLDMLDLRAEEGKRDA